MRRPLGEFQSHEFLMREPTHAGHLTHLEYTRFRQATRIIMVLLLAALTQYCLVASSTLETFNQAFKPLNPAVKVAPIDGMGQGLIAMRDVKAGDVLLSVPHELHLNPSSYLAQIASTGSVGAQLASAGQRLQQTPEGASCLLALGLLHEKALGERSQRSLYLSMLPTPDELEHPLLWEPSYVESLLKGSHLVERISRLRADLSREFEGIVSDVLTHDPEAFPLETYTEALYVWAHAIVLSRSFSIDGELSLVPLLDIANHESGSPHTWRTISNANNQSFVALIAGARVSEGEHVCIDCSRGQPRATWEYLFSYGFVPEVDLPPEAAAAHWLEQGALPLTLTPLRPIEEDPIAMQKRALLALLLDALGFDEASDENRIELSLVPSDPERIAPFLRLGVASSDNAPELAAKLEAWMAEPRATWATLQAPLSADNERLVAQQVLQLCDTALQPLPPSAGLALAAAREPTSVAKAREQAAARVLLGERHAVEACREHWQRVLQRL